MWFGNNSIFIPVCLFLWMIRQTRSLEYKCYKDICDSSSQFCNNYEQRCETCGLSECNGENNFVKFDQCQEACQSYQSTTTTMLNITTAPPKQSNNNGISTEQILLFVILTLVLIVTIAVIVIYRKLKRMEDTNRKNQKTTDPAKQPLLVPNGDIEMGNIQHIDCTEDSRTPTAPPSYETGRRAYHPTESFDSPTEPHPADCNLLADNTKFEETMRDNERQEDTQCKF